jgi:hypothetical protein
LTTFSHPALRVVADAKQSDLGSLVFSRYWQLSDNTSREPAVSIGARLATGEPLLAARQLGQGSVLSLAASLDSNGSNLPSRQAFVALLHELIYHLVDPGGQRLNRQPAYVVNVPLTRTRAATGLRGEYFRRSAPDVVVVSRIDPQLDFQWGQDAPAAGLAGDSFGVRWSGGLVARVSGDYTFHVEADDSADLTVNGQRPAGGRRKELSYRLARWFRSGWFSVRMGGRRNADFRGNRRRSRGRRFHRNVWCLICPRIKVM